MMDKLMKNAAYGTGAAVLLAGSFSLFAALSGTEMSEMKGVGGAFPDAEQAAATASQGFPHPQDELDGDRRSTEQVLHESASPLKAFLLPSGFTAGGLAELEQELEQRMAEVDLHARDLDEREKVLEQDRQLYDELFADLEVLRESLLDQSDEARARDEELAARNAALQAQRRASFATLARTIYDEDSGGAKAKDLAPMLRAYEPEDAALILVALPAERATSLVTEVLKIDEAQARSLQDAYMAASATPPAR
jgi:hypothetical protein